MIRHFLRNDSEEAELTELIQAFPGESPTKSQRQQEGFQKEQEERFCKNQDEEGRLRREHQEDKLREEQHKDDETFPREQQHEEKERLCRKHLDEKLRRDQQDEERLRKERQQEVRLWQSQQDKLHMDQEKFQWECQVEEERPKHDQQRCYLAQREESYLKEPEKHFHNNEESEISNVVRHISDDIEEVRDFSQTLPVMPPKWGCPVMPPPSPSRPKSPWGKLDPYDSCEEDRDYVGFATLPNQVHRKYVKKGFEFTLMVAGESGLGKSTLINSLFLTDLYRDRQLPCPEECVTQTVEIVKQTVDIQEKGVRLRLTVVDTPGYGDAVNNENCWKPIADYIDQQFEQYFRDESGLNRKNLQDTRVHCCLYFLSPLGHGMRPLDIEFLRALQDRVNIVPILGKADSLTTAELLQKKQRIRDELDYCGIRIYQFPDCDSDQDEEFKIQDMELKKSIPFAVIGSNTVVEVNGRRVRGRIYPWGVVEVENEQHCDFVKLRTMLIRTHMQDLKDVTRETHYENYRAQCIQSLTQRVVRERNRNKLTRESGTDFPIPSVPPSPDHETQRLIREKDEELRRMQEVLQKMQRQMKDSR
ncbi:septin-4-like isoform X2 [Spea bombifrons]|uniref:septin-4-like isoform X2 n=1 Tax=Spea bombifrons TaxID=233779 RepID=UPI002349A033|nr:septin-4-like isoform X2 [Spea bombifrons]